MARLYVPGFYQLQQQILYHAWDNSKDEKGNVTWPTVQDLATKTGHSESMVLRAVYSLQDKELAHHNKANNLVYCRPKGEVALHKEEILEEGWEKFKANLLRWTQIVGIVSATLIGVGTFIWNVQTTNKNKVELELLKREVQALKQKQVSVPRYTVRPSPGLPVRDSVKKK